MAWSITKTAKDVTRLYELASIFIRYGFGDVVEQLGLGHVLEQAGKALKWKEVEDFARLTAPQRARRAMEEMGPTFIKLGQILATRVDMFSPDWIAEFEKLQSHVPPVDFEELRPQLEEDLGAPPEEVFAELDTTPLGSASMAQAYRARLTDGSHIILKIRRPGIRPMMESDLRLLTRLAEIAEEQLPDSRLYNPKALMRQFTSSLRSELNLATECRHAERAAANLPKDSVLVIPKVYWQWTCERLNVQELIEGIPGKDLQALEAAKLDRKYLAQQGAATISKMVLEDGFFQADPHPGNIFYLSGNRLALVDWGMVGRMPQVARDRLIDLLHGLVEKNIDRVVEILVEWSGNDEVDRDRLSADVEEYINKYYGMTLKKLDIAVLFSDLTFLLRENRLSLPPDLAMMIKVFITLEGLGRQLNPDFDLMAEAQPILRKALLQRYSPNSISKRVQQVFSESIDLFTGLPKDLRQLLKALRSGSLKHRIEISQLEEFGKQLDNAASRLAVSFVTAAFIIGTSVVVASDKGPTLFGIPFFEIFGYCAMLGGLWLLISIWWQKR
jgi:ubiquinone biosynthesis protein